MNNYTKIIIVGVVGLGLMFLFGEWSKRDSINNVKWDDCINLVNKFIPDPNSTESRSEFIKNCYEQ